MKNVCALVTLFNPDAKKTCASIREILGYADRVYLLFNSPVDESLLFDERITAIDNGGNVGLSMAFNVALKAAHDANYKFAVLFDQDSFLTAENFSIMYDEFSIVSHAQKVMCIGPSLCVYGQNINTPRWMLWKKIKAEVNVLSVKNVITSGMLLNISEALKIGGFDETFPVDFCDFYFCYKALYNGYVVLKSKDSFIQHEIGNSNMKIGKSTIHFHAPYRNYFLVRDTLRIVFRCRETPTSIRFRYLFFLPLRMILFIVRLDKKKERLNMYYLGFKDFIRKNYGFGSIGKLLNSHL